MKKQEWGIKRICLACSARFYDLNKSPIICPACGATFDPEYITKKKAKQVIDKVDDVEAIEIDVDEAEVDDVQDSDDIAGEEDVLGVSNDA